MAPKNGTANCVIGEGSVFEGRFYVNGSIHIEGKFQGDIRTDDELVVGETGQVKTDITARKVTVAGTLIGNITASEEVHLTPTGRVLGNIRTPKLTVEPGVITSGDVTITSAEPSSVAETVALAYGADANEAFEHAVEAQETEIRAQTAERR